MWSCETCGRPNKSNPLICETCGAAAPDADPGQVSLALQRDLPMEAHLRALALWYRVGAVLLVVGGVAFVWLFGWVGKALMSDRSLWAGWHGPGAMWAGALGYVGTFLVAAAAGSWLLGHFLSRYANGARIAAGVLTLLGLVLGTMQLAMTAMMFNRLTALYGDSGLAGPSLAGPVAKFILSTLWMISIAWTLWSRRAAQVCAPAYRTIVARTAELQAPMAKSPFFIIPLVGLILVTLMLSMVFLRLHSYGAY